ncbi:MAG: response regulator [Chloroflexota bacterium]
MTDEAKLILLVEDDPDHEALTMRAFARNNFGSQIVVVRDGTEAIEWLLKRGAHESRTEPDPQIVLLDLELPGIDGLEVLRQMRADPRTALLPVVILTSSKEETDVLLGYELRANSYIQKPVEFARFVEVVREIGLYWLGLNEPPPETH